MASLIHGRETSQSPLWTNVTAPLNHLVVTLLFKQNVACIGSNSRSDPASPCHQLNSRQPIPVTHASVSASIRGGATTPKMLDSLFQFTPRTNYIGIYLSNYNKYPQVTMNIPSDGPQPPPSPACATAAKLGCQQINSPSPLEAKASISST